MGQKVKSEISDKVKAIRRKLESGEPLSSQEKKLEVSRDETAYILSALAGREIKPAYIKQITRGEKPRLTAARAIGNTYLYMVEALLHVRFTKAHEEPY